MALLTSAVIAAESEEEAVQVDYTIPKEKEQQHQLWDYLYVHLVFLVVFFFF